LTAVWLPDVPFGCVEAVGIALLNKLIICTIYSASAVGWEAELVDCAEADAGVEVEAVVEVEGISLICIFMNSKTIISILLAPTGLAFKPSDVVDKESGAMSEAILVPELPPLAVKL
jgi:hypothetical protein